MTVIISGGKCVDANTHRFPSVAAKVASIKQNIKELETSVACENGSLLEIAIMLLQDARADLAALEARS